MSDVNIAFEHTNSEFRIAPAETVRMSPIGPTIGGTASPTDAVANEVGLQHFLVKEQTGDASEANPQ